MHLYIMHAVDNMLRLLVKLTVLSITWSAKDRLHDMVYIPSCKFTLFPRKVGRDTEKREASFRMGNKLSEGPVI